MTSYLLSFLILMLYLMISINVSSADPSVNILICGDVRVQNVSKYSTYYSEMTENMIQDMSRNKFAFRNFGEPPERLHLLAQCMSDLNGYGCYACFMNIKSLIPDCFPSAGARAYRDGCFIRADNYSFYADALTPQDTKMCSSIVRKDEEFETAVKKVVHQISTKAPRSRGFAVAEENLKGNGTSAQGVASCLKTMDRDMCSKCLSNASAAALSCLPSVEARVFNAGCFLRFSNKSFTNYPTEETTDFSISLVILAMIGILAIFTGVLVCMLSNRRKMHRTKIEGIVDVISSYHEHFLQFKYATLAEATENYHEDLKLGCGGYGEVYKGTFPDGVEIAVKRLFVSRNRKVNEICNEMDIIGRAEHKNLVRFLGGCFTNSGCFLVYEFLPNGSLDLVLFDQKQKKELDWTKRLQIITGTAEGLRYLHKACPVQIIHGGIRASNVLLDMRYRPKISDFGLVRLYSGDDSNTITAGTL